MKPNIFAALALASVLVFPASAAQTEDASSVYLHGLIADRLGRPVDALSFYRQAAELDPSSRFLQDTLADLYLRLGRMDDALAAARRAASLAGNDPSARILLGRVFMARGERTAAASVFDEALALDPTHGEALLYSAYLRASVDPAAAIHFLERYLKENPGSTQALVRIAELQESLRQFGAAEAAWKRARDEDSSDPAIHAALGRLAEDRGDHAAAAASYEAARFLSPDDIAILVPLGDIYHRLGRAAASKEVLEKVVRLDPRNAGARFGLALLAEEEQDWATAVEHMAVSADGSDMPAIFMRLAYEQSMADRPRDALKTLTRLRKKDPENLDVLFYMALAYEDLGHPRKALRVLEELERRDSARAEASFHMAANWDTLKRFDKAEPHLRHAITLKPDYAAALNYLGYSLADRGEHLEEAESLIRRALALDGQNPAYLDSLGWCLFKQGRLDEAASILSGAALAIHDAVVWEHAGDVFAAQGKKGEAMRAWEEGLLADPGRKELKKRLGARVDGWAVTPLSAARSTLKRVEANFITLRGAAGAVGITARLLGRAADADGVFYYRKAGDFRLEVLGGLWVPQAVVVRNARGVRVSTDGGAVVLPPQVAAWLDALAGVLSGATTQALDRPEVKVKRRGSMLTYVGEKEELEIDGRRKLLTRWSGNGLSLRFEAYRQIDGTWWPGVIRLEAAGGKASVNLSFKAPRMNPPLNDALFKGTPQ